MRSESKVMKILPVNLLLEGKSCLVVGGGPIAARKIEHLLEAGAKVTVVSVELCPDVMLWQKKGRLACRRRAFKMADLKGPFMVFAATNQEDVNRRIIHSCQRRGLLCCAVDSNWAEGNFLTPATLRHPALTLTISTGGASCRRARMVKDYLDRHLDIALSADLMVLTAGHKGPAGNLGTVLHRIWGVHEFLILEGGARLEVLAIVARDPAVEQMLKWALSSTGRRSVVTVRRGHEALDYTDRIGTGKSGFVEAERLRGAMEMSVRERWAGPMMRDWLQAAIHKTAPGYNSENSTHAGLSRPVESSKADRYELIIRGFQGRNAVE